MAKPIVYPTSVEMTIAGLGMYGDMIILSSIPSAAQLTVKLILDGATALHARVKVTVYRVEKVRVYDPGEPPDIPAGYTTVEELFEVAQSDGITPVGVEKPHRVKIDLVVEQLSPNFDRASGTLLITGDTWDPIAVPLTFQWGSQVSSQYYSTELTAEQGGVATTTVTAQLVSGPAVEVNYEMRHWGESTGVSMEPAVASLRIHAGETKTTTLTFRVNPDCPAGTKYLRIQQSGSLYAERYLTLVVTPARPAQWHRAVEAIQAKATVLSEGPPGPRTPISEVEDAGRSGFVQRFSTGNIYWHPDCGAKWVYGAILAKYRQLGGPTSFLGYPRSDEASTPNASGRLNEFQGGDIYFSAQSDAKEIHGPIQNHWKALGATTSYLGFPTFDQRGQMSRFQRGTIQLQSGEFIFDVSDARDVKTGVIHVNGAAANGWAELSLSSSGGWKFRGSMRSTGALGYDVLMVMSIDLQPFGGPVIAFTEKGDVEGSLVLGGNRAHTWEAMDMDERVQKNWELIRNARVHSTFTVEFGPGDLLAVIGSILSVPLAVIAIIGAGLFLSHGKKRCGRFRGNEYYNPESGQWSRTEGDVWIPQNDICPPGLDP